MNKMREIRIEKITLNIGAGKDVGKLEKGVKLLKNITGINPVKTVTQKRIPTWGLRPGLPIGEVDKAARDVIELAGYGEYFIHRTGHGLGLEGHEEPYIRGDNLNNIEIGMSFTIEPGIYLPNRGGVRIEDDVIITENGCESLTDLPRELIRIG